MTNNLIVQVPSDLKFFLEQGKELVYDVSQSECGKVKLKHLEDLARKVVYVDAKGASYGSEDPHYGIKGYYVIEGIDLIAECGGYDPDGILMWIPNIQQYATWDSDHWILISFPGITWSEIVQNPVKYLDAQWRTDLGGGEYVKAWLVGEFKEGTPF